MDTKITTARMNLERAKESLAKNDTVTARAYLSEGLATFASLPHEDFRNEKAVDVLKEMATMAEAIRTHDHHPWPVTGI